MNDAVSALLCALANNFLSMLSLMAFEGRLKESHLDLVVGRFLFRLLNAKSS